MLVDMHAAGSAASVISVPRDSHVYVPPVRGEWAGSKTTIDSAYA